MTKRYFVINDENLTSWSDKTESGESFPSKGSALVRARKLAESEPGQTFLVCVSVEAVRCPVGAPQVTTIKA